MMDVYRVRAERGAALLDGVRPGWEGEVVLDRLAMESCDRCLLGQLWGSYEEGWRLLLVPMPSTQFFSAADHGFTIKDRDQEIGGDFDGEMDLFRELGEGVAFVDSGAVGVEAMTHPWERGTRVVGKDCCGKVVGDVEDYAVEVDGSGKDVPGYIIRDEATGLRVWVYFIQVRRTIPEPSRN